MLLDQQKVDVLKIKREAEYRLFGLFCSLELKRSECVKVTKQIFPCTSPTPTVSVKVRGICPQKQYELTYSDYYQIDISFLVNVRKA